MRTSAAAHRRLVDEMGRKLGERTTGTTSADHLELLRWAEQFGADRSWAVEDCRHLSRRLERDLLGVDERIVRVPPKMMAHARLCLAVEPLARSQKLSAILQRLAV